MSDTPAPGGRNRETVRAGDPWNERREAFTASPVHREGADLDRVVTFCEPGPGVEALDVATGGGHVARRLRDLGCRVVTADAAPGMRPDVVCPAEALPFADRSFDVVVCRLAVHHFGDPTMALGEMARVSRRLVVIEDGLWVDELVERAERLRDPTHVRAYSRREWLDMLATASLHPVETVDFLRRHVTDEWLGVVDCGGPIADEVRRLLAHHAVDDGAAWLDTKLIIKAEPVGVAP